MKKLKKYFGYLAFSIIGLFSFGLNVQAADYAWPTLNADMIPGEYKNMEYCVYTPGKVFQQLSTNPKLGVAYNDAYNIVYSDFYSKKKYIFIYDYSNKDIKFLVPDKFESKTGKVKSAKVVSTTASEASHTWEEDGDDQEIFFEADLYSYMVDKDGKFQCKELYFVEEANGGNIFSADYDGDLLIHNYASIVDSYAIEHVETEAILKSPYEGQHFGESIVDKCKEVLVEFSKIENYFVTEKADPEEQLRKILEDEYQAGQIESAQAYFTAYDAMRAKVENDITTLGLAKTINDDGFYMGNCKDINDLETRYNTLTTALDKTDLLFDSYRSQMQTKLQEAELAGEVVSEKDREALKSIEQIMQELNERWQDFKKKMDLGKKLTNVTCEGMIGEKLLNEISTILTWIRISVPIILIILGSVDFAKAVLSDDQQELKKSTGRFVKRCIIAVAIFFIPSLIMYILSFIDKVADVSCDIRLW